MLAISSIYMPSYIHNVQRFKKCEWLFLLNVPVSHYITTDICTGHRNVSLHILDIENFKCHGHLWWQTLEWSVVIKGDVDQTHFLLFLILNVFLLLPFPNEVLSLLSPLVLFIYLFVFLQVHFILRLSRPFQVYFFVHLEVY